MTPASQLALELMPVGRSPTFAAWLRRYPKVNADRVVIIGAVGACPDTLAQHPVVERARAVAQIKHTPNPEGEIVTITLEPPSEPGGPNRMARLHLANQRHREALAQLDPLVSAASPLLKRNGASAVIVLDKLAPGWGRDDILRRVAARAEIPVVWVRPYSGRPQRHRADVAQFKLGGGDVW